MVVRFDGFNAFIIGKRACQHCAFTSSKLTGSFHLKTWKPVGEFPGTCECARVTTWSISPVHGVSCELVGDGSVDLPLLQDADLTGGEL